MSNVCRRPSRRDAQSVEQARILATSLRVADALRSDPHAVLAQARDNVTRWGWTLRPMSSQPGYQQEWLALLDQPVDAVLAVLEAPLSDEHANHLRSTQPFAGVLHYAERWRVRGRFRELLAERGYAYP